LASTDWKVGGVICEGLFVDYDLGQAFEALLKRMQKVVKVGSKVVELYAGVGSIGLSLAAVRKCRFFSSSRPDICCSIWDALAKYRAEMCAVGPSFYLSFKIGCII
jgi:hypothetical protein